MSKRAALAWLNEEDWQRWREIDPDLPPYDQWLAKVNRAIADFRSKGITLEKVPVDPGIFTEWCKKSGVPTNSQSRASYASYELMKRATGN